MAEYAYRADPAPEHDKSDPRRRQLMRRDPHCHHCRAALTWRRLRIGEPPPGNYAMLARVSLPDDALGSLVLLCPACHGDAGITGPVGGREWHGGRHRRIRILRGRDGDDCAICGKPIDFRLAKDGSYPAPGATMGPSVDHKKPRAAGGTNTLDNLQLTHGRCNQRKGAQWDGINWNRRDWPEEVEARALRGQWYRKANADAETEWDSWSAARR